MWLTAGLWGWLAGGALLIGALLGWFVRLPVRLTAGVMAFGSGVLLSALSFDLMDEAHTQGGMLATALGFLVGAVAFTAINYLLSKRGAKLSSDICFSTYSGFEYERYFGGGTSATVGTGEGAACTAPHDSSQDLFLPIQVCNRCTVPLALSRRRRVASSRSGSIRTVVTPSVSKTATYFASTFACANTCTMMSNHRERASVLQ